MQHLKKRTKKGRYSKLLILLIFLSVFIYIGIVLWLSYKNVLVPDSLTIGFFACMTGEFSALGYIKGRKIKEE